MITSYGLFYYLLGKYLITGLHLRVHVCRTLNFFGCLQLGGPINICLCVEITYYVFYFYRRLPQLCFTFVLSNHRCSGVNVLK